MNLIDAHCHLANLNDLLPLDPLIKEARRKGIKRFLSSALRKIEVEFHLRNPIPGVLFSAGIHPNFDECDLELRDIELLCEEKLVWAIGEIGLDRNNIDYAWQTDTLIKQLELAQKYNLPVVLHLVGRQQEAFEILKSYSLKYLVHGYAGSLEGYQLLARLGSVFTISSRILKDDKADLLKAIVADGAYLFETDMTQYYVKQGEANPLLRLLDVVDRVSELAGTQIEVLESCQNRSANHLGVGF